jgi:orotate phosphoribosyltransferase
MLSYKESLKILKETNALLEGHFVLSSGLHSDKYVQCAQLLSKPSKAKEICLSLAEKIKENFKSFDLIVSPAMGGVVIGYEIGRILGKETIFAERVNGKFELRRGFKIQKNQKILIVEDVITTGKSSLECTEMINKHNGNVIGYACIIDRSNDRSLIKKDFVSQIKIEIPTYNKNELPDHLKKLNPTKPGSRNL